MMRFFSFLALLEMEEWKKFGIQTQLELALISLSRWMVMINPKDTVLNATKKMLESQTSFAIVAIDKIPQRILTSKDILMRVLAQDLSPESILVDRVMTPNPECATTDAPIVDALHPMHDGNFLHLHIVVKDGIVVDVVDVLHITHAAVATVRQQT
ncbi:hypothetical protein FXO37_29463 [Capsicum annuum]|nr:hypothetical protein FXO37_29463 [Capsicum annuum]